MALLALFALAVILLVVGVTRQERSDAHLVTGTREESGFQEWMSEIATRSNETRRVSEVESGSTETRSVAPTKTGRLRLRVIDAGDGAALAGATCVVYAERNGPVTYGTLTTDDDGRASIDSLPENTILVHVERKPPRASAYAGVWLCEGETRDIDVRVGAGGVIVGRAVDDAGQPLADVEVFLDGGPTKDRAPEARTASDGRFEVACVVSKPKAVWIVDGALRPGSWEPVNLRFEKNGTIAGATVDLEDGRRIDVGDVVLARPSRLSGRVLDAQRNPVGDAVIGWGTSPEQLRNEVLRNRKKGRPVGDQKDRVRTRPDGSFELAIRPEFPYLVVATTEGIVKWFTLTNVVAGESRNDLELILDDVTILEIELVDERGSRVTAPRASPALADVTSAAGFGGRARIAIVCEDGSEQSSSKGFDDDGLFRIQALNAQGKKRVLRLNFPGYLPVAVELQPAVGLVDRQRIMLRDTPCLRTHLKVLPPKRSTSSGPHSPRILVQACLLGPTEIIDGIRSGQRECCGLGSTLNTPLAELERDVELPVGSEREVYWIHVIVLQWRPTDSPRGENVVLHESHAGPFAASATIQPIEIPSLDPSEPPANAKAAAPPPPVVLPKNEFTKSDGRPADKAWKTRLRFEEADGRPVPKDTVFSSATESKSAATGRALDENGTAGFEVELAGLSVIHVREMKADSIVDNVYVVQVIEVPAIETYGSRPIVLAPWCPVDIVVRGDVGALPGAALQAHLVLLDKPRELPDRHAILSTREAAPLPDHARRFRGWAAPGKYEIRLKSGLFTAPKTEVEVRNTDALQTFELSSTRR